MSTEQQETREARIREIAAFLASDGETNVRQTYARPSRRIKRLDFCPKHRLAS